MATENISSGCEIEFKIGADSHSSCWAKFYVRGLDPWQVKEDGDAGKHANNINYVCLNVPAGNVFTIFEQDGNKRGTDVFKFAICITRPDAQKEWKAESYDRFCTGNFEVLTEGNTKIRAGRLMKWWIEFVGENDKNGKSNEEKIEFANHCATYVGKRGVETLPPMASATTITTTAIAVPDEPQPAIDDAVSSPKNTPTEEWLTPAIINLDAGTQTPTRTNPRIAGEYLQTMMEGLWQWDRNPLPVVFFDGEKYYTGDGHHRIKAAQSCAQLPEGKILCEVRQGTLRDAIFFSCQANQFHGLQRTREDKRAQVETLLRDSEWSKMSDRAIAAHIGVSGPFVGGIRERLEKEGAIVATETRTDKKGREIATGKIGKPATRSGKAASAGKSPAAKGSAIASEPAPTPTVPKGNEGAIAKIATPKYEPPPQKPNAQIEQFEYETRVLCANWGAKRVALWIMDELTDEELEEVLKTFQL